MDIYRQVIGSYQTEVKAIYEEILAHVNTTAVGSMQRYRAFQRLAALTSAATKRAKRELIFGHLLQAKAGGLDITPTVARHSIVRVLKRSVSMAALMRTFGSPGRTATDKSTVQAEELADLERLIIERLSQLEVAMVKVREAFKREYEGLW